jgi:DNA-binding NarL/FixJ family response regulator
VSQPDGSRPTGVLDVVVEEVVARGALATSPACQIAIQLRVRLDQSAAAEAALTPPDVANIHQLRNAREQAVVGLLARGYTDERIARDLGLSKRTVSYTISGLMGRLGARNRFQLGWVLSYTGTAQSRPGAEPSLSQP